MWQCFTVFRKKKVVFFLFYFVSLTCPYRRRRERSCRHQNWRWWSQWRCNRAEPPTRPRRFWKHTNLPKTIFSWIIANILGFTGKRSCIVILNISKVMDKVYVLHENLYVQSPEKFWNKNEKLGFWSVCFAWKPVSPVSREIAETSLLACGHI